MFEPNFLTILNQIEEEYGQQGKEIALTIRKKQVSETIANMGNDFMVFRNIVNRNIEAIHLLFGNL